MRTLIAFALAAALIICFASAAGIVACLLINPPERAALESLFLERWQKHIRPESLERTVYLAAVMASLPAVVVATGLVQKYAKRLPSRLFLLSVGCLTVSVLMTGAFIGSDFANYLLSGGPSTLAVRIIPHTLLIVLALVIGVALLLQHNHSGFPLAESHKLCGQSMRISPYVNYVLLAVVLLTVIAVRLRSAEMIYGDMHYEAVFYSVSQVMAGKTLLTDLPSQYGLYAEILRPLLGLTGVSVVKFSALMVFLQGISALALLAVCASLIRLNWLRVLAVLTISAFVGSTWIALGTLPIGREYFQAWPIRFFFPAVTLLIFVLVRYRGMQAREMIPLAALSGVAVIWNLDSGVPVLGALIAYLVVRLAFGQPENRRRNRDLLIIGTVVPALVIAAFVAYLSVKGGGINWWEWLKYQRIFYYTGLGMLPIPTEPHVWLTAVGLYLYGLVSAVILHLRSRPSVTSDTLLYLSVLGLGLFTYYQGRSHDIVLSFVIWPAILIAFILADRALRGVRVGALPQAVSWSVGPIVAFGVAMSLLILTHVPHLIGMTYTTARALLSEPSTPVRDDIAFIKAKVGNSRSAVILDPGQSILFGETGLASAIGGPGLIEMLLVEDWNRFMHSLLAAPVDHLFVRLDRNGRWPHAYRSVLSVYRVSDISKNGLQYLEPCIFPCVQP